MTKTKITNISSIYTWSSLENQLDCINDVEILIHNGKIIKIDKNVGNAEKEINANGALITPGFIDSHTHSIFFGNRSNEYASRISGLSYEEISSMGGGIISSIKGVRNATEDELYEYSRENIELFLSHGTTTIETKSGYGLTIEDEIKSLRVIKRLNEDTLLDIIPTFMGAHSIPPEYKENSSKYVDLICEEMIPAITTEKLAKYCDVFCEQGYFSKADSKKILETGIKYGLVPRIHADEFLDSGGAELASIVCAASADHLMAASDDGISKMAKNSVIATLLPGTTLFLGKSSYANGRKMIDMGCDVALATDFNPGSCTIQSMPIIITLANLYCGLTIEEAFKAVTWNAAKSLQIEKNFGSISQGYQADLIFWNLKNIEEISYWMGSDRIQKVMKKGEII